MVLFKERGFRQLKEIHADRCRGHLDCVARLPVFENLANSKARVFHKRLDVAFKVTRNGDVDHMPTAPFEALVMAYYSLSLISEDEERRALEETQKLTDNYISRLDQAVKTKEKEVLEIK